MSGHHALIVGFATYMSSIMSMLVTTFFFLREQIGRYFGILEKSVKKTDSLLNHT